MRLWPRRQEQRSLSISDPALAGYFNIGNPSYAGVNVGESTALGLTAVWRAVSLISQTVAQLPLRTLRDVDGVRTRVSSFLDTPGGPEGPTSFEWTETVLVHLLLHGNAFLAHQYNGGGAVIGLTPIHPLCVSVECHPDAVGGLLFTATLADGSRRTFDATTMTFIPALTVDGIKGLSPISVARNALATAVAGDRSAARMFANGALISGIVTPEEDLTEDEGKVIKESLDRKMSGWENAGDIALVNRKLNFMPWTMSAEDAQFLQSRQFQIEEIARLYGIPPHALMQTEKQTSWGSGVAEQNRGLSRTVLAPWCARIEQRLSRLLPKPRFVEFDMAGLERGSPAEEIDLLIKQVQAGLLTVNEARRIRNMDPIPGGDSLPSNGSEASAEAPLEVAA